MQAGYYCRKFSFNGLPQEFVIHTDIPVDHFVPQPGNTAPRDVRIPCTESIRQHFRCLSHNGKLIQHSGPGFIIRNKFFKIIRW